MNKIGIFGGTFNPIHNGHLILAENALVEFELDKVIFIPSGLSYQKKQSDILAADKRLKMVEMATISNPNFEVSDIEIKREGESYTYETLESLAAPDKELYLIMGGDSLCDIVTWKKPEVIMRLSTIIVACRQEEKDNIENVTVNLRRRFNAEINIVNMPVIEISSTDIRNRKRNHKSIRYMVPDSVYDFILKNKCYEDRRYNS